MEEPRSARDLMEPSKNHVGDEQLPGKVLTNGYHTNGNHANGSITKRHRDQGDQANGSSPIPNDTTTACRGNAGAASIKDHKQYLERKMPSIVEIKKKIPAHCFESSLFLSLYYVAKDAVLVALLYLLTDWSLELLPCPCQLLIAPLYWYVQGTIFFAIFVLGHDCGHGSFSSSELLNDVLGTALHTVIMVPYMGWKLSHRNHHKNTGNIDKDEIFYPVRQTDSRTQYYLPGFGLGFGWYTYLVRGYSPRNINHFNPLEPLYRRHMVGIVVSALALLAWIYLLYCYVQWAGWNKLVYHYVLPDFVFASHLVVTTFLHHVDRDVPWYADGQWDYVRGQVSSVDRHYGWCHDLIHNIGTHQIHHLFPKIPHYHLEEATAHFRCAFPELVQRRDEPILPAFCRMFREFAKHSIISSDALIHVYT